MAWHPRGDWTSAPKGGTILAGTGRTITTIYIHYPGQKAPISVADPRGRLEGYRRYHKGVQGWVDIAYNVAVDQRGDVWELRGIDRQTGANGGTRSNRTGMAVLVLVGDNERPTDACIAGIRDAVRRIRQVHPAATAIRGHQQSPDASTDCPGPHLMALVRSGALDPTTSKPAPQAASTEETELMAAKDDIINALRADIHALPAKVWGGPGAPMVNRRFEGGSEYPETTLGSMTDRIVRQQIIPMRAEIAALTTAIQQLATAQGVDPAAVERAVKDAVAHALDGAQVTATISRD